MNFYNFMPSGDDSCHPGSVLTGWHAFLTVASILKK
jgi:hypothetical protein